jgi:hypothetical protein
MNETLVIAASGRQLLFGFLSIGLGTVTLFSVRKGARSSASFYRTVARFVPWLFRWSPQTLTEEYWVPITAVIAVGSILYGSGILLGIVPV